uniref:CMP/dCMP-type deaminase domain-containing protein n=1 Tax=Marmota marmota marmota TaxID=9994 RepID=A0A8C5ZKQ2_MARMA
FISRLYRKTFLFHFRNLRWALGRNNTFLCYQVDREERDSTVFLETRLHAELCFLYWLHDYPLQFPDQHLQITWFISWSPCSDCAQQVAAFLASHSNLSLTIYAARLYYFWNHSYQEGLRALQREGARVEIMSLREHTLEVQVLRSRAWESLQGGSCPPFVPLPHSSPGNLNSQRRVACS